MTDNENDKTRKTTRSRPRRGSCRSYLFIIPRPFRPKATRKKIHDERSCRCRHVQGANGSRNGRDVFENGLTEQTAHGTTTARRQTQRPRTRRDAGRTQLNGDTVTRRTVELSKENTISPASTHRNPSARRVSEESRHVLVVGARAISLSSLPRMCSRPIPRPVRTARRQTIENRCTFVSGVVRLFRTNGSEQNSVVVLCAFSKSKRYGRDFSSLLIISSKRVERSTNQMRGIKKKISEFGSNTNTLLVHHPDEFSKCSDRTVYRSTSFSSAKTATNPLRRVKTRRPFFRNENKHNDVRSEHVSETSITAKNICRFTRRLVFIRYCSLPAKLICNRAPVIKKKKKNF